LASTPASELASEILDACLKDGTWPQRILDDLIERALDEEDPFAARAATRAFFSIVIERLGDLFEPALCDVYARLFSYVIGKALPAYDADELVLRYNRVRQVRRFPGGEIKRVFVLSRVTLGADVAVTSVALAAAKERFPHAQICFVGPEKNAELFAADSRIVSIALPYGRSSLLRERLQAGIDLLTTVDEPSSIVIDPDSRLTQLGLIPPGDDDSHYFFFESRAFGGTSEASIAALTASWLTEVFGVENSSSFVAAAKAPKIANITVSLGVGDNAQKRVTGDFEYEILAHLLNNGNSVLLDRGAGGEEGERVDALVQRLGQPRQLHVHDGSYGSFAAQIVQSRLYVGYDSAGQHVAAAANVPLVSVFKGFASPRMLSRWRPDTPDSHVVVIEDDGENRALDRTLNAIAEAGAAVQE
jgi:ADP-heptose:LPS heptosyltransferase